VVTSTKQAAENAKKYKMTTSLRIPPNSTNSGAFQSEPRDAYYKKIEKIQATVPPVGGYYPKFNL
jgi:S-methylmethionine-dependent homocysteine/selenocysteine methylase